jgi:site-specific recombinase XerD
LFCQFCGKRDRGFVDHGRVVARNVINNIILPRPQQKISNTVSLCEIEEILFIPNRNGPDGLKDCAMLELTYGGRLRISELCSLELQPLDFEESFFKPIGKGVRSGVFQWRPGSKERCDVMYCPLIHNNEQKVLFLSPQDYRCLSDAQAPTLHRRVTFTASATAPRSFWY